VMGRETPSRIGNVKGGNPRNSATPKIASRLGHHEQRNLPNIKLQFCGTNLWTFVSQKLCKEDFYSAPVGVQSIVINPTVCSVCLSVHEHNSLTDGLIITKFVCIWRHIWP